MEKLSRNCFLLDQSQLIGKKTLRSCSIAFNKATLLVLELSLSSKASKDSPRIFVWTTRQITLVNNELSKNSQTTTSSGGNHDYTLLTNPLCR